MGATVFNIPDQIKEMVRYTEYISRINKSEIYRKAISYFIENGFNVSDEVLYMPLAEKPCKEQVYIDSCRPALDDYRKKLQNECGSNLFPVSGKGIMQKKNRYRNSTLILQAIINYLVYLYADKGIQEQTIKNGLRYINDRRLVWRENRS